MAATDCSDVTSHWQASAWRPACSTIFTVSFARRHVGDGDVHAVLGETLGKRLADAVGRSGDDGDFVLVAFGHVFSPFASAACLRMLERPPSAASSA